MGFFLVYGRCGTYGRFGTDLLLGAGVMRSIQRRRAKPSTSRASEIAFYVRASAWTANKLSIANVYFFLARLSLPKFPNVNLPSVFLPFFMVKV